MSGSFFPGGGWIDGIHQFYDHWILYGSMQWICDPGRAEVRRGRLYGDAEVRGECGLALSGVCGGHDDDRGTALHEYPAVDEHAGGHYPGRL